MNQIFATSNSAQRWPRQTLIDVVVGAAMGLVAIAVALALNLHFGLPMSRSVIVGVMMFALLIGAHFMIVPRESAQAELSELEDEELWRTLKEQRRAAPDADRMAMATRSPAAADVSPDTVSIDAAEAHIPRRKPRIMTDAAQTGKAQPTPERSDPAAAPDQSQALDTVVPDPEADSDSEQRQAQDYWSYRPSDGVLGRDLTSDEHDHTEPTLDSPLSQHPAGASLNNERDLEGAAPESSDDSRSSSPRESDVELVQSMIKKLAHQVNASEKLEKAASDVEQPPIERDHIEIAELASDADALAVTPPPVPAPESIQHPVSEMAASDHSHQQDGQMGHPLPPSAPAQIDLVGASVEALRTTAGQMREAEAARPEGAPNVEQPLRPAKHPHGASRAEGVTASLAAGQFGVLLEPILSVDGLQPQHYEVHVQLNTPAQEHLQSETLEADLQATGALPQIDQQRFASASSVGQLLLARGKTTDIVVRMYRESLLNRDFCYGVASNGVANEQLARRMVLALSQDVVRSLTASEWQTLSEFREIGYRFAMCEVHDIDMDFSQLTAVGFGFVKIDAHLFLNGGSNSDPTLAPQELARYFAGVGLDVILDGVDTAALAAQLAKTGALLVQGQISGGPRLMRADVVQGANNAVA